MIKCNGCVTKVIIRDKSEDSLDISDGNETSAGSLQCRHSVWSATLAGLSEPESKWQKGKNIRIQTLF